jgi:hypothetical protein
MILYGIASALSEDIFDFYATQEAAVAILAGVVADEPEFEGVLWVERVELGEEVSN